MPYPPTGYPPGEEYGAPPYDYPPPTPPGPREGDTRTDAYGTWTYINGQWVLTDPVAPVQQYECPYCGQLQSGYEALSAHLAGCSQNPANVPPGGLPPGGLPPGAGLGGGGGVPPLGPEQYPPGSPEWMEERYGRWPGYGTALGLYGREALSPFEQYMSGLQQPLESLYDIGGRMALGGHGQYAPGGMFSQWAPQYAQNPFAMYGLAQGMMGDVFGMSPEQRGETGMTYGGGSISDLLMMALRPILGKQTAGWLTGRLPQAQQQWTSEYPGWVAGGGQPSFIDYIKEKYNLGQWF